MSNAPMPELDGMTAQELKEADELMQTRGKSWLADGFVLRECQLRDYMQRLAEEQAAHEITRQSGENGIAARQLLFEAEYARAEAAEARVVALEKQLEEERAEHKLTQGDLRMLQFLGSR